MDRMNLKYSKDSNIAEKRQIQIATPSDSSAATLVRTGEDSVAARRRHLEDEKAALRRAAERSAAAAGRRPLEDEKAALEEEEEEQEEQQKELTTARKCPTSHCCSRCLHKLKMKRQGKCCWKGLIVSALVLAIFTVIALGVSAGLYQYSPRAKVH